MENDKNIVVISGKEKTYKKYFEKAEMILKAPLALVINQETYLALIWIITWGIVFNIESYLIIANRKHFISYESLIIVTSIGVILEITKWKIAAFVYWFIDKVYSSKMKVTSANITRKEWELMIASAIMFPAMLMIIILLFFQGKVLFLFGGISLLKTVLLMAYVYYRTKLFRYIGFVVVAEIISFATTKFILVAILIACKVFGMFI